MFGDFHFFNVRLIRFTCAFCHTYAFFKEYIDDNFFFDVYFAFLQTKLYILASEFARCLRVENHPPLRRTNYLFVKFLSVDKSLIYR